MATVKELVANYVFKLDQSSVNKVNSSIDSTKAKGTALGSSITSATGQASEGLSKMGSSASSAGSSITSATNSAAGGFSKMGSSASSAGASISSAMSGATNSAAGGLSKMGSSASSAGSSITSSITSATGQASKGFSKMGSSASSAGASISSAMSGATNSAAGGFSKMGSSASSVGSLISSAMSSVTNSAAGGFSKMGSSASSVGSSISSTMSSAAGGIGRIGGAVAGVIGGFNSLGGAVAGAFGAMKFSEKAEELAEFNNLTSTFIPVESQRLDYADAIYKMSQKTASSYSMNKDLTADIASNLFLMGSSSEMAQEHALGLVSAFRQAGMLGTQATGSLQAAVLQLKQAVAKGVLQGDELRSLKATAPKLIEGITKAYSFANEKALQDFASKGNLTIESLLEHLPQIQAFVDKETANAVLTPKQAINELENTFDSMFDHIASKSGILKAMGAPLTELYSWLKEHQPQIEAFFTRLSEDMIPKVAAVLGTIGAIGSTAFEWLSASQGPAMQFIEALLAVGALVTILTPILGILQVVWGILAPIGTLFMTILEVVGTALSTAFLPIVVIVAVLAGAFLFLKDNWAEFEAYIQPSIDRIIDGVARLGQAWELIQPFIQAVIPIIKVILELVGGALVGALTILFQIASWVFDGICTLVQTLAGFLNRLAPVITRIADGIGGLIEGAERFLGLKQSMDGGANGARDRMISNALSNTDNSQQYSNNTTTNNYNLAPSEGSLFAPGG